MVIKGEIDGIMWESYNSHNGLSWQKHWSSSQMLWSRHQNSWVCMNKRRSPVSLKSGGMSHLRTKSFIPLVHTANCRDDRDKIGTAYQNLAASERLFDRRVTLNEAPNGRGHQRLGSLAGFRKCLSRGHEWRYEVQQPPAILTLQPPISSPAMRYLMWPRWLVPTLYVCTSYWCAQWAARGWNRVATRSHAARETLQQHSWPSLEQKHLTAQRT